jgi:ADP-heptose:LPS heptosyltransferase
MKDIAILSLTRFGDQIQVTPVVAGFRRRYPEARLHLIIKRIFRSVTDLLPGVDLIHELDGDALTQALTSPDLPFVEKYQEVRRLIEPLLKERFDLVLNLTHSNSSAVLSSMLAGQRIVGATLDRQGGRVVESAWLRHISTLVRTRNLCRMNLVDMYLGAAGFVGSGERLSIGIPASARSAAAGLLPGTGPRIAIQLGANDRIRAWPVDRFAAALKHLHRRVPQLRPVLVGVKSELPRAEALQRECPDLHFDNLVGKTEIAVLGGVLKRTRLLLTGDTGTMHVAAAVGTPTCALFLGPAYPHETGPYAEGHWLVHSRVECAPCNHLTSCGFPVCHLDIPPEWLGEVLFRILSGTPVHELPSSPRVDLLQSRFDEDGLWEAVPAHPRKPEPQDLLSLAYRDVFGETLGGLPGRIELAWARAASRHGIDPDAWSRCLPEDLLQRLEECKRIALEAEKVASGLSHATIDPSTAQAAGTHLRELDGTIYTHARAQPLLLPLAYAHEGDLQSLPEGDLQALARNTASHYQTLRHRIDILARVVRGPDSKTFSPAKEASS